MRNHMGGGLRPTTPCAKGSDPPYPDRGWAGGERHTPTRWGKNNGVVAALGNHPIQTGGHRGRTSQPPQRNTGYA